MWMKGRARARAHAWQNAKHAFFGALDAISGRWHWADHDRKLAVHFVAFLDQLAGRLSERAALLALDNAPMHTRQGGRSAGWRPIRGSQLLWLPKYAAHEVNPVERIWGRSKSAVAADRLEGNLATLVGHARRFCAELRAASGQATSCCIVACLSYGHVLSSTPSSA